MKLSEAILLGSTVLAPKAGGQLFTEKQAGCALGMAAVARGCSFRPVTHFDQKDKRTLGTEGVWGRWVLTPVARPCQCWRFLMPREMRIKDVIAHLFDHHVMRRKNWTLEQLVEWVKTVEPKDAVAPSRARVIRPADPTYSWRHLSGDEEEPEGPSSQEAKEWQAVRQAFATRHVASRRQERLNSNSAPARD